VKKVLVELVVKSTRPVGAVAPVVAVDITVAVQLDAVFTLIGVEHATVLTVG
jgi:hypothetical protein